MASRWGKWTFILILLVNFFEGSSRLEVWASPDLSEFTLNHLAQTCSTPEALVRFLKETISFKEDPDLFGQPDYWQEPEEFLARRAGDCEDYAVLTQAILTLQGKEAFLLSLYGPQGYAHTVCVFIEGGRYNAINEDQLIRYRASSLQELATFISPVWSWAAVAEQVGHRGRAVRHIQNPSPAPLYAVKPGASLYSDPL